MSLSYFGDLVSVYNKCLILVSPVFEVLILTDVLFSPLQYWSPAYTYLRRASLPIGTSVPCGRSEFGRPVQAKKSWEDQ